jgi:hypothetical protein
VTPNIRGVAVGKYCDDEDVVISPIQSSIRLSHFVLAPKLISRVQLSHSSRFPSLQDFPYRECRKRIMGHKMEWRGGFT